MTDEQINVAIAKAYGWKNLHSHALNPTVWVGDEPLDDGTYFPFTQIPDFCNDLKAMHQAEEMITGVLLRDYFERLKRHGKASGIRASARQRAEAFLRTLGKWEEVQS